jgi:hypothetical protein
MAMVKIYPYEVEGDPHYRTNIICNDDGTFTATDYRLREACVDHEVDAEWFCDWFLDDHAAAINARVVPIGGE